MFLLKRGSNLKDQHDSMIYLNRTRIGISSANKIKVQINIGVTEYVPFVSKISGFGNSTLKRRKGLSVSRTKEGSR